MGVGGGMAQFGPFRRTHREPPLALVPSPASPVRLFYTAVSCSVSPPEIRKPQTNSQRSRWQTAPGTELGPGCSDLEIVELGKNVWPVPSFILL